MSRELAPEARSSLVELGAGEPLRDAVIAPRHVLTPGQVSRGAHYEVPHVSVIAGSMKALGVQQLGDAAHT